MSAELQKALTQDSLIEKELELLKQYLEEEQFEEDGEVITKPCFFMRKQIEKSRELKGKSIQEIKEYLEQEWEEECEWVAIINAQN